MSKNEDIEPVGRLTKPKLRRAIPVSQRQPWDKRPGETIKSFLAFQHYLACDTYGVGRRSHVQVAFDLKLARQGIQRWAQENEWVMRADAYDAHMAQIEQEAKEKVAREYAERTERRRRKLAEKCWGVALKLMNKCEAMLEKGLDGDNAARWSMSDAAKFAKTAADLGTMAVLGMYAVADDGFDPLNATPDQLRAYIEKHGVKSLPTQSQTSQATDKDDV